jgi:hypothetical protein
MQAALSWFKALCLNGSEENNEKPYVGKLVQGRGLKCAIPLRIYRLNICSYTQSTK